MAVETPVDTFEIPNVDVNLTLRIYHEDGSLLASATVFVPAGTNGWVRFDFKDGIVVEKNAHLHMALVTMSPCLWVEVWRVYVCERRGYYLRNAGWGDFLLQDIRRGRTDSRKLTV
jgi:hypothetical protein